jgi:S-formylglutathione hydrolase FrmB
VRHADWIAVVLLGLAPWADASANPIRDHFTLGRVNRRLHGQVIDYTRNHGADRRIWSAALGERRDLYVYLPPGYDPCRRYPLMIWLHGFAQDEVSFLRDVIEHLDAAIAKGQLPPLIIAAPDGSLRGIDCLYSAGSFFLNTPAGAFEDFLMVDVWEFLHWHYPILPEREAHVIAGVSMGGGGAYHTAIKYRERFGVVLGIFPPVNVRWMDCHGRYMGNFDPDCWGWRTDFSRGREVVGRFYGVFTIRQRQVTFPLYGRRNPDTTALISRENPIEMLDAYDVRPGQLAMYVAYGGRDQFNIDAQVESFLYCARARGLAIRVSYDPRGKHDRATALRLMPEALEWLAGQMAAYK